jgi:hypothetical protein
VLVLNNGGNIMENTRELFIDLSDLEFEDVEVLVQEGGRGIPEFAASSCQTCGCGTCSCSQDGSILGGGGD